MEPQTAESVACSDGTERRIEALQDEVDLWLDLQEAHVQPGGFYHYHGVPEWLIDAADVGDDPVHIWFAADGHLIYYSREGEYEPSYRIKSWDREVSNSADCEYRGSSWDVTGNHDGTFVQDREYVSWLGDLDECNGTYIGDEYVYFVTDEYPYISRCLRGDVSGEWWASGEQWGWSSQWSVNSHPHPHPHGHWHPPHRQ